MNKKIISALLSLILICTVLFSACGKDKVSDVFDTNSIPAISESTEYGSLKLNAKSAIIYDINANEILYTKNAGTHRAPASLVKLLTASTALYYLSEDTVITVGSEQDYVEKRSSMCFIQKGHKLTLRDLICGLMLPSGGDAAHAIAVTVARHVNTAYEMNDKEAIQLFVDLMNGLASEIGMKNSHFQNPDGWDHDEQYVTAEDMMKLTAYAMHVPLIKEISSTASEYVVFESGQNITWKNTNSMIQPYSSHYNEYITGGKTGSTDEAGKCLATIYEDGDDSYIIVVLGCKTDADRYKDTEKLIDFAKDA